MCLGVGRPRARTRRPTGKRRPRHPHFAPGAGGTGRRAAWRARRPNPHQPGLGAPPPRDRRLRGQPDPGTPARRTGAWVPLPERNPDDWAYSQLNLGLILDRLAREGEVEPEKAVAARQAVIDRSDACAPYLVGHAHHRWVQQILDQAQPNPLKRTKEELEARDNLNPDPELLSRLPTQRRTVRGDAHRVPNTPPAPPPLRADQAATRARCGSRGR
jgi:hypothetical protein